MIGSTLYGMTISGGTNGLGCVFKINTDGSGFYFVVSFDSGGVLMDASAGPFTLK